MSVLRSLSPTILKIAIALLSIGASMALAKFVFFPLIDNVIDLDSESSQVLARTIGFLSVVFPYWAFARFYECRKPTDLAANWTGISIALAFGIVMIGIPILLLYGLGYYQIVSLRGYEGVFGIAGVIFVFAVVEEIVFRGVLFRISEERIGTVPALLIVALLFGLLHLANAGVTPITVLSVTIYGMMWTGIYILSRNIWVVSCHHAAWNFTIFATGLPVSGLENWSAFAPFESIMNGPDILTGSGFGPEDSIISILLGALSTVAILSLAYRRGKFPVPDK